MTATAQLGQMDVHMTHAQRKKRETRNRKWKKAPGKNKASGARISATQDKLAREVIKSHESGENVTKEALMIRAGYSPQSAKSNHGKVFGAPGYQTALRQYGFNVNKLAAKAARVMEEAMDAKKTIKTKEGDLIESDVADHDVRLKAANLSADVLGLKKVHVQQTSVNVTIDSSQAASLLS